MPLTRPDALEARYDVCVVGTGPAGLACALSCHTRGLSVLLLEAGGTAPVPGKPDLLSADISEAGWHDPTDIVSASALGGTSHWWGGRSVPFDAVDFRTWPVRYEEMLSWYAEAAEFLGAKAIHETSAPGAFAQLKQFDATGDETWCPQINMAKRWRAAVHTPNGPATVLGARVTGLVIEDARVTSLHVRIGADERTTRARHVVLACGGLGGLKLLLLAQREQPSLFGGAGGPLGRGYMGHLTGCIADLAPSNPEDAQAFGFRPLDNDIHARRRLRTTATTVTEAALPNTAFWLDNAYNENPTHGSSVSSAKYVAARLMRQLASLGRRADEAPLKPHLDNIARAPVSAALGLGRAAYLLASTRLTGRLPRSRHFTPASAGAWLMRYHAEQLPDPANRISLSTQSVDSVGLPRLHIDFRFSANDCEAVVRTHELLDADLRQAGAGALRWHGSREQCAAMVSDYARDGYHQIGGAIMSTDPSAGVVDAECRAHGLENLWVASSSTFPSGSQANPTLTIVAFARRIAARLAKLASAA